MVLIFVVIWVIRTMQAESVVSERLSDAMQNSITITIFFSLFFEYPEVCLSSEDRVTLNHHSKWRQFPHVLVFVQASCTCLLVHITEFVLCWPEVVLNPSVFISREGRGITLEPGLFGALLPHCVVALLVFRGVSRYKNLSFRLLWSCMFPVDGTWYQSRAALNSPLPCSLLL